MAQEYRALPGGDGGEWAAATEPPRHLVPVAQSTAGQPIRKRPVKTKRVDLDGDYLGWYFVVRTNAPIKSLLMFTRFQGADDLGAAVVMGEVIDALPAFMVAWNFVDFDGNPMNCDPTGFATLDAELLGLIIKGIGQSSTEASEVDKSDPASPALVPR